MRAGDGHLPGTLFRVFNMHSWPALMTTETMACDPRALTCRLNVAPPLFFIAFLLLGSMVLLNRIIAVTLGPVLWTAPRPGGSCVHQQLLRRHPAHQAAAGRIAS